MEEVHDRKVMSSNSGTKCQMDIFVIFSRKCAVANLINILCL